MAEKFEKIVNFPHKFLGRVGQEIMRTQPDKWYGKAVKGVGLTMTGVAQFLFWATKYVALDNHALRAGERKLRDIQVRKNKDGENKKLQEFMKRYPSLSSHMIYYAVILLLAGGVKAGVEISDLVEQIKIEREVEKAKRGTYAEYVDKMRGALPYLVADLIAKEGVHVENGMHTPYLDGRGIWTIGFGSTVLKDRTSVNKNTPPITTQEAYELACWHIMQKETLFELWCYDVAFESVDISSASELVALLSAMYNVGTNLIESPYADGKKNRDYEERFAELHKLHQEKGDAITAEEVRAVFQKYPVKHMTSVGEVWLKGADKDVVANSFGEFLKGGNGLRWRRWLEAQVMKGNIQPEVFLKIPVGSFYEFYKKVGDERTNWFLGEKGERVVNDKTLDKFHVWLANPVDKSGKIALVGDNWRPVLDWLPKDVAQQCLEGKCEIGAPSMWDNVFKSDSKKKEIEQVEIKTYVIGYDEWYADAVGAYRAGDYNGAVEKYQNMIAQYPDNALLRNDFAATYNKLGQYNEAIAQAREVVQRIGDKSQYGAAQYNAGFAYEQMGNLQKALANYKLALANGNRRVQKDITRVSEKSKQAGKVAFNSGIKQVHQKNAKKDLLLYGQEYKGNIA